MRNAWCPRCSRVIEVRRDRFADHRYTRYENGRCFMSQQVVPATGFSDRAFERRAEMVTDLACQIQDADPQVVWHVLTALPADELQRLLIIALAGIPIDKPITEIWDWVLQLPAAKVAA